MDNRPSDFDYGQGRDTSSPPYGYQPQQPYMQNSWQQQQGGQPPYNNSTAPVAPPYGQNPPYYGEQQPYYGGQQHTYAQESHQGYPPQQTYSHEQSYNQYPPSSDAPHASPQPPYGYNQNESFYPPPHQQPAQQTSQGPPGTEEERGVMGALAGGAAGAYGGHKMGHHGFLGGIAGAFAGHKLEESYKDHKKQTKPHSRRSSSSSSSSDSHHHGAKPVPVPVSHHAPQHAVPAGNFSASSRQISLDGDYDLIAECGTVDGRHKLSSISLNKILTNNDGHFGWVAGGGNFGGSARNVRLVDGGKFLEAELCSRDGHWKHSRIWLDEKITNNDGELQTV
jgi:uncharacterized protein YcfJ